MSNPKHDCFVGNLTYNTTEDQLRDVFSAVGEVKNIRICTDRETGRAKGYAFVEYSDAATALSAIRNLDGREFNNRKLRVSYSNNSSLKEVAREMGQVVHDSYQSGTSSGAPKTTEEIVSAMKLDEAHDILAAMKRMIEEDGGDRAKMILDSHPQLIPALIQIQNRLGMAVPQHLLDSSMAPPDAASIPSSREDGSNFMVHQAPSINVSDHQFPPTEMPHVHTIRNDFTNGPS